MAMALTGRTSDSLHPVSERIFIRCLLLSYFVVRVDPSHRLCGVFLSRGLETVVLLDRISTSSCNTAYERLACVPLKCPTQIDIFCRSNKSTVVVQWRLNFRMVMSAKRVGEPANLNPHPGPFPSPTNATSISYSEFLSNNLSVWNPCTNI